jgi:hypothetical protein
MGVQYESRLSVEKVRVGNLNGINPREHYLHPELTLAHAQYIAIRDLCMVPSVVFGLNLNLA